MSFLNIRKCIVCVINLYLSIAIAYCHDDGVKYDVWAKTLSGIEFRIDYVRTHDKIKFLVISRSSDIDPSRWINVVAQNVSGEVVIARAILKAPGSEIDLRDANMIYEVNDGELVAEMIADGINPNIVDGYLKVSKDGWSLKKLVDYKTGISGKKPALR